MDTAYHSKGSQFPKLHCFSGGGLNLFFQKRTFGVLTRKKNVSLQISVKQRTLLQGQLNDPEQIRNRSLHN